MKLQISRLVGKKAIQQASFVYTEKFMVGD